MASMSAPMISSTSGRALHRLSAGAFVLALGVASAPAAMAQSVDTAAPTRLVRGQTVEVVLRGAELDTVSAAQLVGEGLVLLDFVIDSDTVARARIGVGDRAIRGPATLQLTTVDDPLLVNLEVVAGQIAVLEATPTTATRGQTLTIHVRGLNLDTVQSVSLGAGITTDNWEAISAIQGSFEATVDAQAFAGPRTLGLQGPLGTATRDLALTVAGGPPSVTTVSPADLLRGTATIVTLQGNNLDTLATISFGPRTLTTQVQVQNPQRATARVEVLADASVGARDATLTFADDSVYVADNVVQILAGPLAVTRLRPERLAQGQPTQVTVEGANLDGITTFNAGPGITVTRAQSTFPTAITFDLQVANDAATGFRDVVLSGPRGSLTLADGVIVVPYEPPPLRMQVARELQFSDLAIGAIQDRDLLVENRGELDETIVLGPLSGDIERFSLLDPVSRLPVATRTTVVPAGETIGVPVRFAPDTRGLTGVTLPILARTNIEVAVVPIQGRGLDRQLRTSPATPLDLGEQPLSFAFPRLTTLDVPGEVPGETILEDYEIRVVQDGVLLNDPESVLTVTATSTVAGDTLVWGALEFDATFSTLDQSDWLVELVMFSNLEASPEVPLRLTFVTRGELPGDVGPDAGEDVGTDTGEDAGEDTGLDAGDTGVDTSPDVTPETGDDTAPDAPADTDETDSGITPPKPKKDGCAAGPAAATPLWLLVLAAARRRRLARRAAPAIGLLGLFVLGSAAGCDDSANTGDGPTRCPPGTELRRGTCVSTDNDVRPGPGDTDDTSLADAPDTVEPPPDVVPDGPPDSSPDTGAGCTDGTQRCSTAGVPQACLGSNWVDQAACTETQICQLGRCVAGAGCTPGDILSCASATQQFVCNAAGSRYEEIACAEGLWCLDGLCGTIRCRAGERRCLDDYTVEICTPDGLTYIEDEVCDRRAQRACSAGECVSGCVAAAKDPSYIGCEYWSADLPQFNDPFTAGPNQPHAVIISNVGEYPATITIESFTPAVAAPPSVEVAPGAVQAISFPINNVDGTSLTSQSFLITTTEPVVAYQFNPFNNVNLFSNDASLLLPISALGNEYYALGWPGSPTGQHGTLTIIATSEGNTDVTVTFSSDVVAGTTSELRGITRGSTRTFTMTRGQVLNFENATRITFPLVEADFSGTRIVSTRPVVVFSGHKQAVIGEDGDGGSNCCADHMEQQLFPVQSWGNRYLGIHSPPRGSEPDYWKLIAARDGTRITTSPAIAGVDGQTINAGQVLSFNTTQSFEVEGSGPILLGQFLVSAQSAGVDRSIGDPAFILAVPAEQFRTDYQLLTPSGYREDWITIIRPTGVEVLLDGAPVTATFTRVGTNTYEYAYVAVTAGPHRLTSAQPFGTVMIGYDNAVSYGVPGGLNLFSEFAPGTP